MLFCIVTILDCISKEILVYFRMVAVWEAEKRSKRGADETKVDYV